MLADVEYNVGLADLGLSADQAIVLFQHSVDVRWPIDQINEALGFSYNASLAVPAIYAVSSQGNQVGYLSMPRDDALSEDEKRKIYVQVLREQNLVCETASGGIELLTPTAVATSGVWNGETIGVVAYRPRVIIDRRTGPAPAFPVELVSLGIWKLMGQTNWSTSSAIFVYQIPRLSDLTETLGLWLADRCDHLGETPGLGREMMKTVHKCNTAKMRDTYPSFSPERFSF